MQLVIEVLFEYGGNLEIRLRIQDVGYYAYDLGLYGLALMKVCHFSLKGVNMGERFLR